MMKILVATEKPFARVAIEQIKAIVTEGGFEFALLENYKSPEELKAAVSDADALIVRSDLVTPEVIAAAPKLKIVVRAGAGYDNLDLPALSARGIIAMNTPGQNANAVAELVFAMLLFMVRGAFGGKTGTELRGKTIGIHAFGNVGRNVAEISKGFGMEVLAFDPFVSPDVMSAAGVKVCSGVKDLYSSSQFVTLHMPANSQTVKSVGYDLMMSMPPDAILINTARKEVINEDDLIKVLTERADFRYIADIEPDCRPLLEEKFEGRCLFTAKKMGAQTEEANINAGIAAARQIVDYFLTGNEKFRLNK